MGVNVIQPPEVVETEGSVLFLAGPIQGARNWQEEAIRIIGKTASDLTIASPRKDYPEGTFVYEAQVDWEPEYLRRAAKFGVALFWLARQEELGDPDERGFYRAYAQTTRAELFEAKVRHELLGIKMVIGIEEVFGNARYIRRRFGQDCPGVPILDNLDDTCEAALELLADDA